MSRGKIRKYGDQDFCVAYISKNVAHKLMDEHKISVKDFHVVAKVGTYCRSYHKLNGNRYLFRTVYDRNSPVKYEVYARYYGLSQSHKERVGI